MRWAVGGWSFFIVENVVLSENRAAIIQAVGDDERETNYHIIYGSCSTLACASIVYGYARRVRDTAPLQWALSATPPVARLCAGFALQALGLVAMAQAMPRIRLPFAQLDPPLEQPQQPEQPTQPRDSSWAIRCPFEFAEAEGAPPAGSDGPHGLVRVSRHSGFWSFGLACLGAACVVPSVPQAAWLAMPTLVALIGGAHADSRHRRGQGGYLSPEHDRATSNVPFLAMLSGAQGRVSDAFGALATELKMSNAALGAAAAAVWILRRAR